MRPCLLKALCVVWLVAYVLIPSEGKSQCTCEGGTAPNELSYLIEVHKTLSSSIDFSFPRFDPALGTLTCVALEDTMSIESTLGIRNTDTVPRNYRFRLTITNEVSGPGINVGDLQEITYGPDLLDAYGNPGDSISYGPDTLFNQVSHQTFTSNTGPFLGASGTVDFNYSIGGGVTSLAGGLNYNASVKTSTWGSFRLTYYWCENTVLAKGIQDFEVSPLGSGDILITWSVPDEIKSRSYEIEVSVDGRQFFPVGTAISQPVAGAPAKYAYQYAPNQPVDGKLYVRIKQHEGPLTRYSAVRSISGIHGQSAGLRVFPNPAGRDIQLTLPTNAGQDYLVDITNAAGQVVFSRRVTANGSGNLNIHMDQSPTPGLYFLRASDIRSNRRYSTRLVLRR